jgi:hypothetical protein
MDAPNDAPPAPFDPGMMVRCPTCGAGPMLPCKRPDGGLRPDGSHRDRLQLAGAPN